MTDIKGTPGGLPGQTIRRYHDENDGTYSESAASHMRYWDTGTLAWERVSGTAGAISTSGGGGGGGAVTVADGADVAQGTTTDAASASTVVGLLKNIKAALAGSLTTTTSWASAQHVIVDTAPSTTVTGPLTDTQLRASRVSVDASGVAVPVTDNSGSLTVDAPVSTPAFVRLSDGAAAITALPITDNAGSLTVDAPVGTPAFVRLSDGAAALVGQKVMASSLPVVLSSDQASIPVAATLAAETTKVIGTVNPPALTKGTQGANGWSVQDLKDSGRTNIALTIEFAFAQTAETLLTVTESRAGAATGTFTSKTITSGKRLRFTGGFAIIETLGTGTTVPQRMYLRLRVNTAGATIASSPLQYVFGLGIATGSAAIPVKASTSSPIVIPDGVEYAGDGTATYGLTLETPDWVITTGTGRCKITLFAFEY